MSVPRVERDMHCPAVWFFSTEEPPISCWNLLESSEQMRADAFAFERDRNSFVATRAVLRILLARELGSAPADVRLVNDVGGKPMLACPRRASGLEFSVAHTDGASLIAITYGGRVGVDIERIRIIDDAAAIAGMMFGSEMAEYVARFDVSDCPVPFLQLWTAGEAFAKATGSGLSGSDLTRSLVLTESSGQPIRLNRAALTEPGHEWAVCLDRINDSYIAAVVVERPHDAQVPTSPTIVPTDIATLLQ